MNNKPKVTITYYSPRWSWFQFILLGFYELEKANAIELKFNCGLPFMISRYLPDFDNVRNFVDLLKAKFLEDSYVVCGTITCNGTSKSFCIDSSDTPFSFDFERLKLVDKYFKMQCPKVLDPEGFRLADGVVLPYFDHYHLDRKIPIKVKGPRAIIDIRNYTHKIKPLAVGFRSLANNNSYKALKAGYNNYKNSVSDAAEKKAMCYFGLSGFHVLDDVVKEIDCDREEDIVIFYRDKVNHPNEKRAKLVSLVRRLGSQYDGRLINEINSDGSVTKHSEQIIPLKDFCRYISNFEYNINISGFRLSIPNRFMESFIVGTAIFTDKLFVKWYLPFEEEVVETVEMGYLKDEDVDWERVENDLLSLPKVKKETVLDNFERKWAPKVLATYLINETIGSKII